MRATIRPVSLSRIAEVTDLCQKSAVTQERIQRKLDVSENRAEEIVAEMVRISILKGEDDLHLTAAGEKLHSAFIEEEWQAVHHVLYENSPHYHIFVEFMQQHNGCVGLSEEEIVEKVDGHEDELRFNATGISLLTDWSERLQVTQRNVFEDRYYWCLSQSPSVDEFAAVLQDIYADLEVQRGVNLRQRYLSIPRLREEVCECMQIGRDRFDTLLSDVYYNNIGRMELSGAPINTQAKEARFGIKTIKKDESGDIVTTQMESEQVLDGISLQDGKMYYYLSIFDDLKGSDSNG